MGFFNKIFGNKEQEKPKDESTSVPVKEAENKKPESNNESDQKFNPADKFDPTKVNSAAAANVNNAEPVGKVDESQFRFRSNDPAQNIQQGQQQMQLNLNMNMGTPVENDEKRTELLQQCFKGPEGLKLFAGNTLQENLFVMSYMQNVMIPKARDMKKDQDVKVFNNLLAINSKMMVAKIAAQEKVWITICKTTGYPYELQHGALFLLSDENREAFIKKMEEGHYNVDIMPVKREELHLCMDALRKDGYLAVFVADGIRPAVGIPMQEWPTAKKEGEHAIQNPRLQIAMTAFFQEMRRENIEEGANKDMHNRMCAYLEHEMMAAIVSSTYLIPTRKDEKGNMIYPVMNGSDKTSALAVYTDIVEQSKEFGADWMTTTLSYDKVVEMVEAMNADAFIVNSKGLCLTVNKKIMEHLAVVKKELREEYEKQQTQIRQENLVNVTSEVNEDFVNPTDEENEES
ncbi:MAG: SseB family protein [Paludibacteraceae bacterium]|nr:SseB family protein [Paludibacteraceae bacterium]